MTDSGPRIRNFFLPGPTGRLEAVLNTGDPAATHAALVCHPHPLYGGTLHNKVVFHAARALNDLGLPALRFNFRGAGLSEGEHDQGRGEVDDVRAALDWLAREFHLPIVFVGFSFGAVVGAKAACPDPRVVAVISIGTPFRVSEEESAQAGGPAQARSYPHQALRQCTKPKLLISGAADPFAPREDLERLAAELPEPEELVLIEGAGHFFEGKLEELREAIQRWVRERVLSGS